MRVARYTIEILTLGTLLFYSSVNHAMGGAQAAHSMQLACESASLPCKQSPFNRTIIDTLTTTCKEDLIKNQCASLAKEVQEQCDKTTGAEAKQKCLGVLKTCSAKDVCETTGSDIANLAAGCWSGVEQLTKEATDKIIASFKNFTNEASICFNDNARKLKMFEDFNASVPKILRVKVPPLSALTNLQCSSIQNMIDSGYQTQQRQVGAKLIQFEQIHPELIGQLNKYPDDLAKFKVWMQFKAELSAQRTRDMVDRVQKIFGEIGLKYNCYSRQAKAEMVCKYGIPLVTGMFLGGPKVLSLLTDLADASKSLKVYGAVKKIAKRKKIEAELELAQKSGASPEEIAKLKAAAQKAKADVINTMGRSEADGGLSSEERIAVARSKSALNRKLTPDEEKMIIKVHEICPDRVVAYDYKCLKLKAKALVDGGFKDKREREILMRNMITGNVPGEQHAVQSLVETNGARELKTVDEKIGYHVKRAEELSAEGKVAEMAKEYKASAQEAAVRSNNTTIHQTDHAISFDQDVTIRMFGDPESAAEKITQEATRRSKLPDELYKGKSPKEILSNELHVMQDDAQHFLNRAVNKGADVDYFKALQVMKTRVEVMRLNENVVGEDALFKAIDDLDSFSKQIPKRLRDKFNALMN